MVLSVCFLSSPHEHRLYHVLLSFLFWNKFSEISFLTWRVVQHHSLFFSGTSPTGNIQSSTLNEVAMPPPPSVWLCSASPHTSPLTLDQSAGPVGAEGITQDTTFMTTTPLDARTGTDDARSAAQWKESRAEEEEMGTAPGPSPTRSGGRRCQWSVRAVPVAALLLQLCAAFNLDTQERVVFTGPRGSYFGYSVEFLANSSR